MCVSELVTHGGRACLATVRRITFGPTRRHFAARIRATGLAAQDAGRKTVVIHVIWRAILGPAGRNRGQDRAHGIRRRRERRADRELYLRDWVDGLEPLLEGLEARLRNSGP